MDQHLSRIIMYSFYIKQRNLICAVLQFYAAQSDNLIQTFRDNLSFPSWRVTNSWSSWTSLSLKTGLLGCPDTSAHYYHSTLRNISEERRWYLHRAGNLKSRTTKWELAEMTVGRGSNINFLVSVELHTWYIQSITTLESHWL